MRLRRPRGRLAHDDAGAVRLVFQRAHERGRVLLVGLAHHRGSGGAGLGGERDALREEVRGDCASGYNNGALGIGAHRSLSQLAHALCRQNRVRPARCRGAHVRRRCAGDRRGGAILPRHCGWGGDRRGIWRCACRQQGLREGLRRSLMAGGDPVPRRLLQRRRCRDADRQRSPVHRKRGAEQGIGRRLRPRL